MPHGMEASCGRAPDTIVSGGLSNLFWLRFLAPVESSHHVKAEQPALEGAIEEWRLARFLQAQQLGQAEIGRKQEDFPAGEALFQCGTEGAVEGGRHFVGRLRAVAAY